MTARPASNQRLCWGRTSLLDFLQRLDEIDQVSLNRFPTFITEFVISWIFKFSFRGSVRINVNASQTVVCPSREAKITRWVNANLVADSFV